MIDIRIPQGFTRAILYVDVVAFVVFFGVIASNPVFLVIFMGFIYASLGSMICCFYAWWKQKGFIDDFNQEYTGFPSGVQEWQYDHSEYPGLIRESEKFSLVAFSVLYILGFLIMIYILIRSVSN